MSILTRFFCKHFARNFHPYKVYCYVSQFLFFREQLLLFAKRWSETDIRFFVSPIITFTSKLWMADKPNKLRSKFLRWSTLKCQIQNNPFHGFISIYWHLYSNVIFSFALDTQCNMHTLIFLTLQHKNMG